MKKYLLTFSCICFSIMVNAQFKQATPPVAQKKHHIRDLHGEKVPDDYYWMYDYFGKGPDSSQVVQYLEAENKYLEEVMSPSAGFQEALYNEMKARIKEKDETVPVFKNGYYYYSRTEEGKQYFKYCRKKGSLQAPEEILLDVDAMAAGHNYYSVTGFSVSPDNRKLAFGVDNVSRRQYTIQVKDLATGAFFPDAITNTSGDPTWANDNETIFYTSKNPVTLLSEKIKRHRLNTAMSGDVVVYDEKDNSNYIGVSRSKNDRYIMIYSVATMSSEIWLTDADKPETPFKVFAPRMKDVLYFVGVLNDRFVIRTNKDGAKNFKLMECPLANTSTEAWKEMIPHRKDVLLKDMDEFKDYLVLSERKNGLVNLRVRDLRTKKDYYIDFGESAYSAVLNDNLEYNTNELRFNYTSLVTPYSWYSYNMATKKKKLLKQRQVLGYKAGEYETERLYATAQDGTKVPVSLIHRKGFKKDGNSPLLLYGYGSYGSSVDAGFNSNVLSLLNRGFTYAIAHIRGGEEMGRSWYEDGKMMKKKNTFTDYIDVAQYLVDNKYTSPAHLYAHGGSAGGLLMGAVANMRPDLFHGMIADVPFVDVVNTMLDESIPLTTNEFNEWGNPKDKDAYLYMKSYSPYENVKKQAYPNILVTTGLHDSQVQYFEPAKWVAKLRAMKTDNNLLLLKTNMAFGHGGASGRFDFLKTQALRYAFLLGLEGITK